MLQGIDSGFVPELLMYYKGYLGIKENNWVVH